MPDPKPVKAKSGTMRVRTYEVLSRAVEEGVRIGWQKAHEHGTGAPQRQVCEHMEREIMLAIDEVFIFDDGEETE